MYGPLTSFKKLFSWYTRRNPVDLWLELLRNAEAFEDWEEAALHLDNLLGLDLWYVQPVGCLVAGRYLCQHSSVVNKLT